MNKSVVAGINVNEEELQDIASDLGCLAGDWPMSYLGLPLGGNPRSLHFWDPIVEKITKRLDGWHKGHLSKGGRLILLQSVLGSIPTYFMSIFKMPVQVADLIEKLMRDFFWEGKEEGSKDHLVRWDVVTKPKSQGGLGVGNIVKRNTSLLGKWLWRFPLEDNSLWHSIIASRHGLQRGGVFIEANSKATMKSPWKSIANTWCRYAECTKLKVNKGDKVRFWEDVWLGDSSLKQRFSRLFHLSLNQNCLIQEVLIWDDSLGHSWNLTFRRNFMDREIDDMLILMQLLEEQQFNRWESDKRIWTSDPSGMFSCSSFFESISAFRSEPKFQQQNFIWKGGVPTKIKVFNWLAIHGKVNTNDMIQLRRPYKAILPQWCMLCKRDAETVDHLLLHCDFSRGIWDELLACLGVRGAFPRSWAEFVLIKWVSRGVKSIHSQLWRFFVHAIAWSLWLERNRRIFEDKERNTRDIWSHICHVVGLWARANNLFDSLDSYMLWLDPRSFLLREE